MIESDAHEPPLPHGVVIAGGQGRRLGLGPKYAVMLGGQSLLARAAARLAPQVAKLAVNVNGPPPPDVAGNALLTDLHAGFGGPLMGILAGLAWAQREGAQAMLTVPVDVPFFPPDLGARLMAGNGGSTAYAVCEGQGHYVCALWPAWALPQLQSLVLETGIRRVDHALDALDAARIAFAPGTPPPFFNVNTPDDLRQAHAWLGAA